MRIRNLKKSILIFVVFALAAVSIAMLSFTLADEGSGDDTAPQLDEIAVGNTNIDFIINDSNDSSQEAYKIVEIGSSATMSDLGKLFSGNIFKDLVLGGYKSEGVGNYAGSPVYDFYYVSDGVWHYNGDIVDESVVVDAVNAADFAYVHNDEKSKFTSENDITEDVKLALSTFATGDFKPFMIDGYSTENQSSSQTFEDKQVVTMYNVAIDHFQKTGYKYYARVYGDTDKSIRNLMDLSISNRRFTRLNTIDAEGKDPYVANKWKDAGNGKKIARILDITAGPGLGTYAELIINGGKAADDEDVDPAMVKATGVDAIPMEANMALKTGDVYELGTATAFAKYAYSVGGARPDYIQVDNLNLNAQNSQGRNKLATMDYSQYDLVIFEGALEGTQLDTIKNGSTANTLYEVIEKIVRAKTYILYSDKLLNAPSTTGGQQNQNNNAGANISANTANNYAYVLDKVATTTGGSRFSSALVTSKATIDTYNKSTQINDVYDIAQILINGSYRGKSGTNSGDDTSNVYTVLEIEPCYPIDLKLASKLNNIKNVTDPLSVYTRKKDNAKSNWDFASESDRKSGYADSGLNMFYYLRTASVSDLTADEISYDGVNSLNTLFDAGNENLLNSALSQNNAANITDYYAWHLSRAKVAHAVNLSYDQVKVVHMSSVEFNASRKSLIDNYDAIYIGGDNSAIKDSAYWYSAKKPYDYYTMYFHNGDTYPSGNRVGVLIGNDITYLKEKELVDYIDAHMPVIIEDSVQNAFNKAGNSGDHTLDPDSNMMDFLKEANKAAYSDNVLWGFNYLDTKRVANPDNTYGKTYGDYVTVFNGNADDYDEDGNGYAYNYLGESIPLNKELVNEEELTNLLLSPSPKVSRRPRLVVTSHPKNYIAGDVNSEITLPATARKLDFEASVAGDTSANKYLYIDVNRDGQFSDNEIQPALSYTVPDEYYGAVYWKVVATSSNGAQSSKTGLCKVKKNDNQSEMVVDLLQIVPDTNKVGSGSPNTLILCVECQLYRGVLNKNRYGNVGKYTQPNIFGESDAMKDQDPKSNVNAWLSSTDTVVNNIKKDDTADYDKDGANYIYDGSIIGAHDHKFGIVKYDDVAEADDINYNFFTEVAKDYNVNMTVLTTRQYESLINTIESKYANVTSEHEGKIIKDKYNSEYKQYKAYYDTLKDVINGKYNTASSRTSTKYKNLETFMDSIGVDSKTLISYCEISGKFDTYLVKHEDEIVKALSAKGTETADHIRLEVQNEYNPEIDPTDRTYYDMYSMVNSYDGISPNVYVDFSEYYEVWRDAKIYELYLKEKAQGLREYSSVKYVKGKFVANLKDSFSCIAIGAAEEFGNDDIKTTNGVAALKRYVEAKGNTVLFHDTLTEGATENMTSNLADIFGQNARHMSVSTKEGKSLVTNKFTVSVGNNKTTFTLPKDSDGATVIAKRTAVKTKESLKIKIVPYGDQNNPKHKNSEDLDSAFTCDIDSITGSELRILVTADKKAEGAKFTATPNFSGTNDNTTLKIVFDGVGNSNEGFLDNDVNGMSNKYKLSKFVIYVDDIAVGEWKNGETVKYTVDQYNLSDNEVEFTVTNSPNKPNEDGEQVVNIQLEDIDGSLDTYTDKIKIVNNLTNASSASEENQSSFSMNAVNYKVVKAGEYVLDGAYSSNKYYINSLGANVDIDAKALNINKISQYTHDKGKENVAMYKFTKYDKLLSENDNQTLQQEHDVRSELRLAGKGGATDKATQNNEGIITLYPFRIDSRLQISPTTMQSYPVDVEDENVVVYYSLAGGSPGSPSSLFAADPNDGQNNYFLYQKGSVTYTGAGHGCVTGKGRNNNDERKLFINIILNSAEPAQASTILGLYDANSTYDGESDTGLKNIVVKEDPMALADYLIKVGSDTDEVEFSFLTLMDNDVTFDKVEIYFDVNNNGVFDDGVDRRIFESGRVAEDIDKGILKKISKTTEGLVGSLQLDPSLFTDDGYAYIVVTVTDSTGAETTKRIRIQLKDELEYLN